MYLIGIGRIGLGVVRARARCRAGRAFLLRAFGVFLERIRGGVGPYSIGIGLGLVFGRLELSSAFILPRGEGSLSFTSSVLGAAGAGADEKKESKEISARAKQVHAPAPQNASTSAKEFKRLAGGRLRSKTRP